MGNKSYFLSTMEECGCTQQGPSMVCSALTRDLERALRSTLPTELLVQNFLADLESDLENNPELIRSCSVPILENGGVSASRLSVFRLLLHIENMQRNVARLILQRIATLDDENEDSGHESLALLLLRQLRWMDFLTDGNALAEELMSCLHV